MEREIIPAIIASDRTDLEKKIGLVKQDVSRIQIDIMDGEFVPRKSNWFDYSLPKFKGEYEAHLMVKNPLNWLKKKVAKHFDVVIAHVESGNHEYTREFIKEAKKMKKIVFLAFSPGTNWGDYNELVKEVDGVLVMMVEPGQYGGFFILRTLEKVRKIREHFKDIDIEVDGAMEEHHIDMARKAGANLFVVGGRIFKSENPLESLWEIEKFIKK